MKIIGQTFETELFLLGETFLQLESSKNRNKKQFIIIIIIIYERGKIAHRALQNVKELQLQMTLVARDLMSFVNITFQRIIFQIPF